MEMYKIALTIATIIIFAFSAFPALAQQSGTWWEFQSIDTMKYSRDTAREHLNNSDFDQVIDTQVGNIAGAGATHVGLGTPYDAEFLPFLKRWVAAARKHNLKVWFRGNWSGWEGWFEYPKINRSQHLEKTREFILQNAQLFEDGDVFTACPECENGGPGDPRSNNDASGHRKFLIDEFKVTTDAFAKIKRQVKSNYHSMNGDVARLIMDRTTAQALGWNIVLDHYVKTADQLTGDIRDLVSRSGGKVVLGEFGAPIPDIHGDMTPEAQAAWLEEAMSKLIHTPEVVGLNYWTAVGGSTQLWDDKGNPRPAVEVLKKYYSPKTFSGVVKNQLAKPVAGAQIFYRGRQFLADKEGKFNLPLLDSTDNFTVIAAGYKDHGAKISEADSGVQITLVKDKPNLWFRIRMFVRNLLVA